MINNAYKFYLKQKANINDINILRQKVSSLSVYDFMCLYGILRLKNNADEIDREIADSIKSYFDQYSENI